MRENVIDDEANQRFVLQRDDMKAQLVYQVEGNTIELVHTGVPEELGGQGIGGELVRAAVDRARERREKVVPSCPYVRHWLEKHPEEATTIAIDWSEDS